MTRLKNWLAAAVAVVALTTAAAWADVHELPVEPPRPDVTTEAALSGSWTADTEVNGTPGRYDITFGDARKCTVSFTTRDGRVVKKVWMWYATNANHPNFDLK